ncbi:prostaglandin D2 synthase 2, hematopoietic [Tolypothrix sp. PCC 7601]|nr:prostaglandin D2 synthase 2, hematopoietic [Tolypothrix sp. PCC 7601]
MANFSVLYFNKLPKSRDCLRYIFSYFGCNIELQKVIAVNSRAIISSPISNGCIYICL